MATDSFTPDCVLALRSKLQLTQVELAEQVGVSQPLVAMWEGGQRVPSGPAEILLRQLQEKSHAKRPNRS